MNTCIGCTRTIVSDRCEHCQTQSFPIVFPLTISAQLCDICVEWHGGKGSSMYSVASTGYIHDRSTLYGLETELRHCVGQAERLNYQADRLRNWLTIVEEWSYACDDK